MTESGLQGLTYLATPQRINLTDATTINGTFDLTVGKDATAGKYTITPRITTFEKDNLTVSLSRPQTVILDTPILNTQLKNIPVESSHTIFCTSYSCSIERFRAIWFYRCCSNMHRIFGL